MQRIRQIWQKNTDHKHQTQSSNPWLQRYGLCYGICSSDSKSGLYPAMAHKWKFILTFQSLQGRITLPRNPFRDGSTIRAGRLKCFPVFVSGCVPQVLRPFAVRCLSALHAAHSTYRKGYLFPFICIAIEEPFMDKDIKLGKAFTFTFISV